LPAKPQRSFLKRWFGLGGEPTVSTPARRQRNIRKNSNDPALSELDQFEKKLQKIAAEQDVVIASNLHVLNIAKIKEKVGDRWDRLSRVIQMNIEAIINNHMKPGDEMLRRSEMNYVIVFANADKEETSRRLQAISHEIIERVFGTDALLEGFELQSTAAKVEADMLGQKESLTDIFASLDGSSWKQTFSIASLREQKAAAPQPKLVVDNARAAITEARRTLSQVQADANIDDFIAILERLSPLLNEAREHCSTLLSSGRSIPGVSPSELEDILKVTSTYAQAIDRLKAKATVIQDTEAQSENGGAAQEYAVDPDAYFKSKEARDPRLDVLKDIEFRYQPVWDPQHAVIASFRCTMTHRDRNNRLPLERLFAGHTLERAQFQLGYALLRQAVRDVQTVVKAGKRCAIVVPISYSSVSNSRDRTLVLQALSHLSEQEKKRLLIEIINIDPNTWSSRISEAIGFLRVHCGAVLLRLPPRYRFLSDLKQAGALAVGHDVAELRLKEANIFEELENLCTMAEKTKIKVFLSGVNAISLASGAIGAGVNFLDGNILPADLEPDLIKFELSDLYAAQLAN
jgi:EAL domain-containing protein (putative c-di-GMP-specific phosphodiesterase class I)